MATLNEVTTSVARVARAAGRPLAVFSPHDLRRTASTQQHEAGYNTDWIEKHSSVIVRGKGNLVFLRMMLLSGS